MSLDATIGADDDGLAFQPARRLRAMMVAGEVSPSEVVSACLARIERLEPRLHCFVTIAGEQALAQARKLEGRRRDSDPGPLFGVPVSIKDQYRTKGIRSTGGSRIHEDCIPDTDATVVARLRAAGAIIVGKTTTPEFGMFWRAASLVAEETRNPWDLDCVSGGSSGGASASVAAGLTPVAIGSDGGGSIRLPAAFCGAFGLFPTFGLVPRTGGFGGALQFTGIGPIARDVADAALLLDVISGPDPADATTFASSPPQALAGLGNGPRDIRALWWLHHGPMSEGHDPEVAEVCRAAAGALDDIGGRLDELKDGLDIEAWMPAFQCMSLSDRFGLHGQALVENPETRAKLAPYALDNYERAIKLTGADYARAMKMRFEAQARLDGIFRQADVIVSPTAGITAPPVPADMRFRPAGYMTYAFPANFAGLPAVTVPCGHVGGMPVGLHLMARPGRDGLLLAIAKRLEEHSRWAQWRPPVETRKASRTRQDG